MSHPNLPIVDYTEPTPVFDPRANPPLDDDHNKGLFVRRSDGEKFALAVHEKDTYHRTHSLKNTAHFWQGNEAEFRAEFEKC